ncbi:MAG: PEP-CTERM sorting domain-containing protein [Planctomycetota bacterium]
MKSTVAALIAVAGVATAANAQIFDIVVDRDCVNVGETVNFSLYLDSQGATSIDTGGAGLAPFEGWAGINGVFRTTGGSFNLVEETDDDAAGGAVFFGTIEGSVAPTDWVGRRPGVAAVNGSVATFPGIGDVPGNTSVDGSDGSFRFSNIAPNYEVRDGGLTLGTDGGGNISGAQSATVVGGSNQDTAERIEVFRGSVTFDTEGDQTISFDGLGSFFIDADLNSFTSVSFQNSGGAVKVIPAPASVAMLGLGALAAGRRRR